MKVKGVLLPDKHTKPFFMVDHEINYIHENGEIQEFPDSGRFIRFRSKEFKVSVQDDLKFVRKVYYINSSDLPPIINGRIYIVSKIAATLIAKYRNDFAYPGTHPKYDGAKIEDDKLVAVRRFRLPDQLVLKGYSDDEN
jgi:hypothetical protein